MKENPFFSCTRCLVYTTRTQTQSDYCLTNVNVDRSAVFSSDLSRTFPFINRTGSFQILQLLVSVFLLNFKRNHLKANSEDAD